mgnify:CR=1 FL=1
MMTGPSVLSEGVINKNDPQKLSHQQDQHALIDSLLGVPPKENDLVNRKYILGVS